MSNGFIITGLIILWLVAAVLLLVQAKSAPEPETIPIQQCSTKLGGLVWAAHEAAQELDAAVAIGDSEDVIRTARMALSAAANLSVELRRRELGAESPTTRVATENTWLDKTL